MMVRNEQWKYRPAFNDHHLQHSSDWNNHWAPWQTSSEEKQNKTGLLQKFLFSATEGENWERNDLNLKDLRNTGKWTITSRGAWKKTRENWIGEQCSEIEENLRKNNNKRAYQLVKVTTVLDRSKKCLTEEREILNRWTGQRWSISIKPSPNRHRGRPTHPSQRSSVCSTIIEQREVRTGPSRWRGRNHRSHYNLQQDLTDRRMPTPWTQSLVITLPKKGNLQQCQNYRTISLIVTQAKSC